MYTDTSNFGYGDHMVHSAFAGQWPKAWLKQPIAVRELYPIMAVINSFGHKLVNCGCHQ